MPFFFFWCHSATQFPNAQKIVGWKILHNSYNTVSSGVFSVLEPKCWAEVKVSFVSSSLYCFFCFRRRNFSAVYELNCPQATICWLRCEMYPAGWMSRKGALALDGWNYVFAFTHTTGGFHSFVLNGTSAVSLMEHSMYKHSLGGFSALIVWWCRWENFLWNVQLVVNSWELPDLNPAASNDSSCCLF